MTGTDTATPLPRGPHGLSREQVERSQRERLLAAMATAVAEKGYANTAVADVLSRASVSRATFYQLFADKEDCFRAAYEATAHQIATVMAAGLDELRSEVASAGEPASHPLVLLEGILSIYLDVLRGAPALARTFLVEVYAAGPRAIAQRRASLEIFVDIVAETHRGQPGLLGTDPEQRFACEALVDAVSSMVTNHVGVGDFDRLDGLREPIMRLAEQLTGRVRPASTSSTPEASGREQTTIPSV